MAIFYCLQKTVLVVYLLEMMRLHLTSVIISSFDKKDLSCVIELKFLWGHS